MFSCDGRKRARRTSIGLGGERFMRLRAFSDEAHHIAVTHAKYGGVDDEEGQQTHAHMQVTMGRNRILRSLKPVDNPRLAAHFGSDPSGQDGNLVWLAPPGIVSRFNEYTCPA